MATFKKFVPGSDADADEIFNFPFFEDKETVQFIKDHGRIMFIVRGPPGTGKKTLTEMILQYYSKGICCSADDYFTKTFSSAVRTKNSLKSSHDYCHTKVNQECMKGSHPIIVSNTHMRKFEMQEYLTYAENYGYTVIMAITTDKFEVSPEILARSNTKGLTKQYFEKRLKQWENVYPILTGWFLCLEDSYFVLQQLKLALNTLLDDSKFCRIFNLFDKEELFKSFQAKEVLFCVAGYSKNINKLKDYYKLNEVKSSLGKAFHIVIEAFLVTSFNILAIVQISDNLKKLALFENFENSSDFEDDIVARMSSLSVRNDYSFKTIDLNKEFPQTCRTAELQDAISKELDIKHCSFIHLAQRDENAFNVCKLMQLFKKSLFGVTNPSCKLQLNDFSQLEGGYRMIRLPNNTWLLKLPQNISLNTIFTGLYL